MSSHLTFKVLVVGDEDVGKTTIVNHYTLMPVCFSGSTVGIEFQSRMVALSADALHDNLIISENSSKNASETGTDTPRLLKISSTTSTMGLQERIKHYDHVKCYFWDTSGSPRYHSLSLTYYRNISAAIVVFDLSNEKTYTDLYSYIHRIIQKIFALTNIRFSLLEINLINAKFIKLVFKYIMIYALSFRMKI